MTHGYPPQAPVHHGQPGAPGPNPGAPGQNPGMPGTPQGMPGPNPGAPGMPGQPGPNPSMSGQPHGMPGQPPPAAAHGHWAAHAASRPSFWLLLAVEARMPVCTRSARIVLAFAPVFLIGLMVLMTLTQTNLASAGKQIGPLLIVVQLGLLLVFSTVIKLVSG